MNIGLSRYDYPEKRCITGCKENKYYNLKLLNADLYLRKIFNNKLTDCKFTPIAFDNFIDAYVFFNDVAKTKKPWISIFESILPRFHGLLNFNDPGWIPRVSEKNKHVVNRLELLSKDNCKAMVAISKSAFELQSMLLDFYPEFKDVLMNKTIILPPPQEIPKNLTSIKGHDINDSKVRFIFVGRDFYRKGGAEIVIAFNKLVTESAIDPTKIELILIGDITKRGNYIFDYINEEEIEFYNEIESLILNSSYITLLSNISNEQVLYHISQADIGLLPTWADTYGYSVLEMQSFNIPVITTNVRALGEINYSQYIIESSYLNSQGEIMLGSTHDRDAARKEIVEGLCSHVLIAIQAYSNNDLYQPLQSIVNYHDPGKYFNSLYSLVSK